MDEKDSRGSGVGDEELMRVMRCYTSSDLKMRGVLLNLPLKWQVRDGN
jgi:hypothetical protein